ncbi:MAG: MATE family efflux transporter [Oliverpabstia sp.]
MKETENRKGFLAEILIPGFGLLRPGKYHAGRTFDNRVKKMLPGMLIEQTAAVVIENMNVFVMGFVSVAAMAGVSQVTTINNTVMNFFQAFAIGGTVMTAQYLGADQRKKASKAAMSSLVLGILVSVLLSTVLFLFRENVIHGLFGQAEEDVLKNSLDFFFWSALTPPLWFLYFQCCGIMRSCGDTKTPMYISVGLNISNILLNLYFVLICNLGAAGSGMAQLISIGISSAISLAVILRPSFELNLLKEGRSTSLLFLIKKIAEIAFPSSIENLMFNGSRIVLQVFLSGMGTVMISANQVFNSVNQVTLVPFMALYYLVIPIMGLECGSGSRKQAQNALGQMYCLSLKVSAWTAAAQIALSYPLCCLFTREAAVISVAFRMMLIYAVFMIFQAACFILPNGFKGAGDVKFAMFFSSATAWIVRVFGTWILGVQFGWDAYALVVTQGLDYMFRGIVYYGRFLSGKWIAEIGK